MTAERGKAEAAVAAGLAEEEGNENKSDRMLALRSASLRDDSGGWARKRGHHAPG